MNTVLDSRNNDFIGCVVDSLDETNRPNKSLINIRKFNQQKY